MRILLILVLLIVALLFGLSSISQSYATAQQAQAAIEASRATQIASAGNLATILVTAVIVVVVLALGIFIAYLELKGIPHRRLMSASKAAPFQHFEQADGTQLLPALMTMLMVEMLRRQDTQQHTMLDISHPEIPMMDDPNDFWMM